MRGGRGHTQYQQQATKTRTCEKAGATLNEKVRESPGYTPLNNGVWAATLAAAASPGRPLWLPRPQGQLLMIFLMLLLPFLLPLKPTSPVHLAMFPRWPLRPLLLLLLLSLLLLLL